MTVVHTPNGASRYNDVITGKILLYMTFRKILQVTFTSMAHLFVWIIWIFFQDEYTIFSEYNTFCFQYGIETL